MENMRTNVLKNSLTLREVKRDCGRAAKTARGSVILSLFVSFTDKKCPAYSTWTIVRIFNKNWSMVVHDSPDASRYGYSWVGVILGTLLRWEAVRLRKILRVAVKQLELSSRVDKMETSYALLKWLDLRPEWDGPEWMSVPFYSVRPPIMFLSRIIVWRCRGFYLVTNFYLYILALNNDDVRCRQRPSW